MNHGRFFKLNQYLSKLPNGIAIYDYTELPAYRERERNNAMSPKYPISVVITSDAVCFRMHYCAFKTGDKRVFDYQYSLDAGYKANEDTPLAHINEVILELPFIENPTKDLTDIVKGVYIANFPQVTAEGMTNEDEPKAGSQFLDKLIEKIFPDPESDATSTSGNSTSGNSTPGNSGNVAAVSFSTLWLMDLVNKDNQFDLYDDNTNRKNKKKLVTKFLRKLLLDFMFDLKHSSVFCTSPDYDRMYNGLMSNFYFSALMHKCEFYFYRELTIRAVEENAEAEKYAKKEAKEKDAEAKAKKEAKKRAEEWAENRKNQIARLYAQELFKAEEMWANDIRNPLSDRFFEQKFPDDFKHIKWFKWLKGQHWTEMRSNVFERMTTTRWDSWFANPEEEMRRIYFVMNENGVRRICNSVVLSEYFMMDRSEDETVKAMAQSARQNRGNTSRWFLNRYDFNDVLHLHWFKWANLCWFAFLCLVICVLIHFIEIPLIEEPASGLWGLVNFAAIIRDFLLDKHLIWLFVLLGLLLIVDLAFIKWPYLPLCNNDPLRQSFRRFHAKRIILLAWLAACLLLLPYNLLHANNPNGLILCDYKDWWYAFLIITGCGAFAFLFIKKRTLRICIILLSVIYCLWRHLINIEKWTMGVWILAVLLVLVGLYLVFDAALFSKRSGDCLRSYRIFRKPYIHPIESWHLLLPKLIASITAAWLTIAMGFDVFQAFFDSPVVWPTMIIICVVVFSFILYQIDRELPESTSWLKVYRTVEMLVISYFLSLCIGAIIIHFVGARYLERSGAVDDYFNEYVYERGRAPLLIRLDYKDTLIAVPGETKLDSLENSKVPLAVKVRSEDGTRIIFKDSIPQLPTFESLSKKKNETLRKKKFDLFRHSYTRLHWAGDTLYCDTKPAVFDHKRIIYSDRGLFIIPNFLMMFSFVAMFIGVFLQMVFFDRKQMTEF